ncbi:hypothetical protein [Kitasatospora sp. NBC_01266]|uniref:hypothetical protein n=1 Tax=Kitasatospora sp. NBC_01266 TaxID=2903572 RepID=UPI002E36B75B|nr:hypothetical protein [Kitasatospora sp. NBC_01266]
MTQDGQGSLTGAAVVAAAERISASLDSLAEALLGPDITRHAPDTLFSTPPTPGGPTLFDTWLTRTGPGRLARPGRGTVVSCTPPRPAATSAGTIEALLDRYDRQAVRGVPHAQQAAAFQLPVSAEPSAAQLRPAFAAPLAELATGRQTLAPAELPTGHGVEVRFAVPPTFHALTVRGADQAAAEQLGEVAEELFAAADTRARRDWAVPHASLLDDGAAADVRFAALAATRIDGRPSNASLVVALHQDRTPIAELAAELATSRPQAEVWTVILPSGPAVVLVQGRTGAIPAPLTEDGTRRWVVSSVVQAFLPLPDGASLLSVQLGTATGEDWELYASVFAELLRSVEFGWDGVTAPAAAASGPPTSSVIAVPPMPPAPPAPPATPPAPVQAPEPASTAEPRRKGTPVNVPPPDFDPFAPANAAPPAATPTPTPTPAPEPAAAPQPLDPFGTVVKNQARAPFAPPTEPERPGTAEPRRKGTPVNVPPPDFDPFAPADATPPAASSDPSAEPPAPAEADPFS